MCTLRTYAIVRAIDALFVRAILTPSQSRNLFRKPNLRNPLSSGALRSRRYHLCCGSQNCPEKTLARVRPDRFLPLRPLRVHTRMANAYTLTSHFVFAKPNQR